MDTVRTDRENMKILVLALSGIGDALMFTPALRMLRRHLPHAVIDVLVMYAGARDIYERNPHVTRTLHFDFLRKGSLRSLRFLSRLRRSYDASINVYPSNRREYNLVNFLIGAPRRLAVQYLRRDGVNLGFLNSERVLEVDSRHNVEENAALVGLLLGHDAGEAPDLEFPLTEDDRTKAREDLRAMGITGTDLVVGFHPGCSTLKNHEQRRWGAENFSALGRRLIERHGARVLIFGGPDEDSLKRRVEGLIGSGAASSVRTGDLAHTAALIERCDCFVTNDSSLMHVAASLRRRIVAVMGPTNPSYVHPWHTEHTIVRLGLECSPCFVYSPRPLTCTRRDVLFKCVREISVDQVYGAVLPYLIRDQLPPP